MHWLPKILIIILCSWMLISCQDEPSYTYLMKHPYYTSKQALRCESLNETSKKNSYCSRVQEAAQNLVAILKEQQIDPESFGSLILETEMAAALTKDQLRQAKSITVMDSENESHRKEIQKLENLLSLQQEKIQILLAVVSISRPE